MAILFSIIATVYGIFSRQSGSYFATNRFFTGYYITKKILQRDFEKANTIRLNPEQDKIILQIKNEANRRTVIYELDTAFIVRTDAGRSDTLYPGAWIAAKSNVNDSTSLLGFIKLRHRYHTQYFYTYLRKRYARADILSDSIKPEP